MRESATAARAAREEEARERMTAREQHARDAIRWAKYDRGDPIYGRIWVMFTSERQRGREWPWNEDEGFVSGPCHELAYELAKLAEQIRAKPGSPKPYVTIEMESFIEILEGYENQAVELAPAAAPELASPPPSEDEAPTPTRRKTEMPPYVGTQIIIEHPLPGFDKDGRLKRAGGGQP